MMRKITLGLILVVAAVWAMNTSLGQGDPDGRATLLAHRGVHQTYAGPPPGRQTCTASPVHPAAHGFIENTLPSMQAAFDAGAQIVEIDVHLTPDNVFAVFHDWTLDCRTNGTGQTNKNDWPILQTLDVGHTYSVDGTTFPLRGQGVGLMPRLEQVFDAFPNGQFLINFKSDRLSEAKALIAMLNENPDWQDNVWGVYGGGKPSFATATALPDIRAFDRSSVTTCLKHYIGMGWTTRIPAACHDTVLLVPINVAPWLWGWPHRFANRMQSVGTDIILVGPYGSATSTAGIDDAATLAKVPAGFRGLIWSNRTEVVGPLMAR